MSVPSISIGCDPELFVINGDGNPISCHEFTPGTKDKPHRLTVGAVQRDGLAMEFNPDPAKTRDEFDYNVGRTLSDILAYLPSGCKLSFRPAITFDPWYFDMLPETVKELGCSPDYNAYSMLVNPPPDTSPHPTLRTASGHMQTGFLGDKTVDKEDPEHFKSCAYAINAYDKAYGNIKGRIDGDTTRQSLYGKLGAFRPTVFGVEHRVPSCAWVEYPRLWGFMFDLYEAATLRLFGDDKPMPELTDWHLEKKYVH